MSQFLIYPYSLTFTYVCTGQTGQARVHDTALPKPSRSSGISRRLSTRSQSATSSSGMKMERVTLLSTGITDIFNLGNITESSVAGRLTWQWHTE